MNTRISIAMATYNGEKYLREQLSSLASQTRMPDELVVCDDGSTDATLTILREFAQQSPFAVHIQKNADNLGYAKNFEQAVSLCTGDVVFLCDQDDVWYERKIERVVSALDVHPESWLVVHDADIVDKSLIKAGVTLTGQLQAAGLSSDQLLIGCCMALRAEMKPVFLPAPGELMGHDGWLNTLALRLRCRLYLKDALLAYRRHGENTSRCPTTSLEPASPAKMLREKLKWSSLKRGPQEASRTRLASIDTLRDRLFAHKDYLKTRLPAAAFLDEIIAAVERERRACAARQAIQQRAFLPRILESGKFYAAGEYNRFEGWKSLIRDILG